MNDSFVYAIGQFTIIGFVGVFLVIVIEGLINRLRYSREEYDKHKQLLLEAVKEFEYAQKHYSIKIGYRFLNKPEIKALTKE